MEKFVGKRVKVYLLFMDVRHSHEFDLDGRVARIEGNLIFLTEVSHYGSGLTKFPDQVINVNSLAFVRLQLLD